MNENVDVVIAGAGPVGLMLACELRLAGVTVLVAEPRTEIDPTLKAGAINLPTAQAFHRRGLLPALAERHAAGIARIARFVASRGANAPARLPGGHFAGLMLSRPDVDDDPDFAHAGPAGAVWFVSQQDIEEILGARAAELGVDVRRGAAVTGFADDGTGVTVELGETRVRARWLVGCDGGRSTVRKRAGFDFPGLDPEITGRQAVAELRGADALPAGWNATPTGVFVHGPTPGRFLTVELDGPPADRDAPVTARELQDSLRRVSGVEVEVGAVRSATRFTDNTRQVTDYRRGRVLLAGDAAHVHSPFGGQGLNLGIGDAVNLGWKLAAVVHGHAGPDLLDTYTRERHPVGAWVLEWTRAQIALMRLDPRSRALRAVVAELVATPDGSAAIFKHIAGIRHRYDLGGAHPLVGAAAPHAALGADVAGLFASGRAVLVGFTGGADPAPVAGPWSDRLTIASVATAGPDGITGLLIRPDGIVAWVGTSARTTGLPEALSRWCGPARLPVV
ncbi:FAD-dependent monooxygenase [Nocardia thailandica]|uniref:FAD-dependent monooxygenase n=1 Tax=Nocardia thailandica TaxID=257275 RepID=A0ABW6PNW3_9NOCA